MATTIYRKYRPQTFGDVTNQNHIKIVLENEIKKNRVSQAYLFTGPRGLGKTTMARLLAKAVNCTIRKEGESEPCNKCDSCREIIDSRSMDVIEVDAASQTGVDNVRENIINSSRFSPSRSKSKVFIIDEVHMLSISAFNALLKVLEEPPAHVIFILATTDIHKVPATIISRCQRFDFKKINLADLVTRMEQICSREGVAIDKNVLKTIARKADGSVRDAESILGQILALGEKEITEDQASLVIPKSNLQAVIEFINFLTAKNAKEAISQINKTVDEGIDLFQFSLDLIDILRKLLLLKVNGTVDNISEELDEDSEKDLLNIGKQVSVENLLCMIDIFLAKRQEIKFSPIPQLPLELAVLEIIEGRGVVAAEESKNISWQELKAKIKDKIVPKENAVIALKKPAEAGEGQMISIEAIKEKWPEILNKVGEANHSLIFIVKMGQVLEVNGNRLKVGFRYKLHADKINENKNRLIIEDILSRVLGQKILLEAVLGDMSAKDDKAVNEALEAFGGKIIE